MAPDDTVRRQAASVLVWLSLVSLPDIGLVVHHVRLFAELPGNIVYDYQVGYQVCLKEDTSKNWYICL